MISYFDKLFLINPRVWSEWPLDLFSKLELAETKSILHNRTESAENFSPSAWFQERETPFTALQSPYSLIDVFSSFSAILQP